MSIDLTRLTPRRQIQAILESVMVREMARVEGGVIYLFSLSARVMLQRIELLLAKRPHFVEANEAIARHAIQVAALNTGYRFDLPVEPE